MRDRIPPALPRAPPSFGACGGARTHTRASPQHRSRPGYAGACITFLRDNLLFPDDEFTTSRPERFYDLLDRIVEREAPGSGGVIFTPWLYGERTPVEDHTVRGGFHNLSLTTTRAQMVRAVMEGVAYNMRWLRDAVQRCLRRPPGAIIITGGGVLIIIISTLTLQVRQVLFLTFSVFPKCKKYSMSEV